MKLTRLTCCFILVTTIISPAAFAATTTWQGGDGGFWSEATNWTAGIPSTGDSAIIASGNCTIDSSTQITDLTVDSGATLTFTNWNTQLTANNVIVDGIITHNSNTDTNGVDGWQGDARIQIICADMTVNSGGAIDAEAKGYGVNDATYIGYGPGGGWKEGYAGGAGHGGEGAVFSVVAGIIPNRSGGAAYGIYNAPIEPGSGGGGYPGYHAGSGGGSILITASGTVTVDGLISADGGPNGGGDRASGGSGGSIFISCAALAGSGSILSSGADGGGGSTYASTINGLSCGGGGGRTALIYNEASQIQQNASEKPTIVFASKGGMARAMGNSGTIYFSGDLLLSETLTGGHYIMEGVTSWSPNNLSVTNGMLEFSDGFTLNVQSNLTLTSLGALGISGGTLNVAGDITMNNGGFRFEGGTGSVAQATIDGNCYLSNKAATYFAGGQYTNAVAPYFGTEIHIDGILSAATGTRICTDTDADTGSSARFFLGSITLDSGAVFDAIGYPLGMGPGAGTLVSYGGGGGGHGGAGGDGHTGIGGMAYDNLTEPVNPGSGGGHSQGGDGGGIIHLTVAGTATINGILDAAGHKLTGGDRGGGGAGGSINIRCATLAGATGELLASGGQGGTWVGGGGGGGIITIRYQQDITDPKVDTWTQSVVGGVGRNISYPLAQGEDGLISLFGPPAGSLFIIN